MPNELPTLEGYGAADFPGGGLYDFESLPDNQSLFGEYSGGGMPRWKRLANREFAQGRALINSYQALYQPTLDLARRSAADYGDLYRRASNEALSHEILAAHTKRGAELADFQTLGPAYIEALRATNPTLAALYDRTQTDLSSGTELTPYERRDVSQSVLEGLSRRGMSMSPHGIYEEAVALGTAGNQRYQQRLSNAMAAQSLYGDVFQATVGRPGLAPAPQGTNVGAPGYADYTTDLFNYGVNREIQGREMNAASGQRKASFVGSLISMGGSAAGGVLGGMCWVAREIFGWTDPRWIRFREWLLGWAPDSVVEWYAANGPAVAQQIADHPELRAVWREWMQARIADLDLLEGNAAK